ncbi:unnamed protein product [Arctogadus glacialis]
MASASAECLLAFTPGAAEGPSPLPTPPGPPPPQPLASLRTIESSSSEGWECEAAACSPHWARSRGSDAAMRPLLGSVNCVFKKPSVWDFHWPRPRSLLPSSYNQSLLSTDGGGQPILWTTTPRRHPTPTTTHQPHHCTPPVHHRAAHASRAGHELTAAVLSLDSR